MASTRPFVSDLRFLTCLGVSIFFEAPFIWNFIASFRTWPDQLAFRIVIFHVTAAIVWLFLDPLKKGSLLSIERYWSRLFAFFVLCFPVFGLMIVVGIYVTLPRVIPEGLGDEEEEFAGVPGDYAPKTSSPWRERVFSELNFLPLADIMEGHDNKLKRGAIDRLAELKAPEFVAVLLKYRTDPSAEIRFHITASLVKIKADFEEQLDAAKKEMQRNTAKVSARIFLARIYWTYALSGLLDPMTALNHTKEAIYHLTYAVGSEFDSLESYQLLGDIYFQSNLFTEFQDLLNLMKEKKGYVDSILLGRLAEIEFKEKRFNAMTSTLQLLKSAEIPASKEWSPVFAWWGI